MEIELRASRGVNESRWLICRPAHNEVLISSRLIYKPQRSNIVCYAETTEHTAGVNCASPLFDDQRDKAPYCIEIIHCPNWVRGFRGILARTGNNFVKTLQEKCRIVCSVGVLWSYNVSLLRETLWELWAKIDDCGSFWFAKKNSDTANLCHVKTGTLIMQSQKLTE